MTHHLTGSESFTEGLTATFRVVAMSRFADSGTEVVGFLSTRLVAWRAARRVPDMDMRPEALRG